MKVRNGPAVLMILGVISLLIGLGLQLFPLFDVLGLLSRLNEMSPADKAQALSEAIERAMNVTLVMFVALPAAGVLGTAGIVWQLTGKKQ